MAPKTVTPAEQRERERIGATLRGFRELRGYRLGEFATALGISYAYLSNIEAGRKPLTDPLLARAAQLLDRRQIEIKHPDSEAVA